MLTAIGGLLLGFSGTAGAATAASCSNFGCDGHNPSIQTWQSGPSTYSNADGDCGNWVDLRYGVTDGDTYAWARAEWAGGCYAGGKVWVDRRSLASGTVETGIGQHSLGASGWTSTVSPNYDYTWSGMYYDSSTFQVRACLGYSSPRHQRLHLLVLGRLFRPTGRGVGPSAEANR